MIALTVESVDLDLILAAVAAAVPATIAAWASLKTNRQVKTNHGKRPGEYIEQTHDRVADLEDALNSHLESDNLNFAEIRRMLEAQNILSAKRAAPFLDAPNPEEISP